MVEVGDPEADVVRQAGEFEDLGVAGGVRIGRLELGEGELHGGGAGAGGEEGEDGDVDFSEGVGGPAHHDVDDDAGGMWVEGEEADEGLGGEFRVWRKRGRRRTTTTTTTNLVIVIVEKRDVDEGVVVEGGGGERG